MDLLPKSEVKFAEKDYWETFFKNRENKDFEWYGEYPELCSQLHKYIKTKDDILVVGCGNSQLSANLYDVGYRKITNIDVSTVVIKQMQQQHSDKQEMTYKVMDAMNTEFADDSYSVVLDKGTLDALMPQDKDEDIERGRSLFAEVSRVLKIGGRYVIVSLLQPHILRTILKESCDRGWMVRVCRCHEVEEKTLQEFGHLRMPVFMVICTKFRKMENAPQVLEVCPGAVEKFHRLGSVEEMMQSIRQLQQSVGVCNAARGRKMDEELEMDYQKAGDMTPRYTLRVVDSPEKGSASLKSYGALIVPQGRETEWMFGTKKGRQVLRKSTPFDRMVVVTLHRDHVHNSLDEIRQELNNSVRQLAPQGVKGKIPFVTVGNNLGKRETVYKGTSEFSGDFVVEDVDVGKDRYRRLIFLNNQSVIQSEALMKKSGNNKWTVNNKNIACCHHVYMIISIHLMPPLPEKNSVLVLGLGGGGLCVSLMKLFPHLVTTAVDIDPAIVNVAKKYFGLCEGPKLRLEVADGVKYLEDCQSDRKKFSVIMMDIDSKDSDSPMSCPPPQFVSDQGLEAVVATLEDEGIFVLNMVCRVEEEKEEVMKRMCRRFTHVARYSLDEDVNEIVFASCRSDSCTQSQWYEKLKVSAVRLEKDGKKKLSPDTNLVDLDHLFKNLTLASS